MFKNANFAIHFMNIMNHSIHNVCVFSGSSSQAPLIHQSAARTLGRQLAGHDMTLIYGDGSVGLMGIVANEALAHGGRVVGVIPQFMVDNGWAKTDVTQLIITRDMHERKQTMAHMSDAVVALPGGIGTMEELAETITWKQLGLINKPIVIANIDGYYNAFIAQLQAAVDSHYMRTLHTGLWVECTDASGIIDALLTSPQWDSNTARMAAI